MNMNNIQESLRERSKIRKPNFLLDSPPKINEFGPSKQQANKTSKQAYKRKTDQAAEDTRRAIASLYASFHKTHKKTSGRGGIIAKISRLLNVHNATVKRVVLDCQDAESKGQNYDPSKRSFTKEKKRKIQNSSLNQHLLSVYKKRFSYTTTTSFLNVMTQQEKGPSYDLHNDYLGRTCVRNAMKHMVCKTQKVTKVTQASDENEHWVRARLNFCGQLAVRFGCDLPPVVNIDPGFVDKPQLEAKSLMLSIHQIAWWDEIHIRQKIGEFLPKIHVFAKTENGVYDEKGKLEEEEKLVS